MTKIIKLVLAVAIGFLIYNYFANRPQPAPVVKEEDTSTYTPTVYTPPKVDKTNNNTELTEEERSNSPATIMGKLCYPSEQIPAMDIYALNVATNAIRKESTSVNEQVYLINGLAPGIYRVYAYPKENSELGGGYTEAVKCGLNYNCKNHTLIDVTLNGGETTKNVDICDWYGADVPPKS